MALNDTRYGILLAAYGASSVTAQATLRNFEALVRTQVPNIPVRWAFTSLAMRSRLAKARKKTDSVHKALQRMAFEKFTHVTVQPLHLLAGFEYGEVCKEALKTQELFTDLRVGCALLDENCRPDAMEHVAKAMLAGLPSERRPHEAVVFMGHGTRHTSDAWYGQLATCVRGLDPYVWLGTMSGSLDLAHVLAELEQHNITTVWLLPLLAVIGSHALNDMAGDDDTSWKSQLMAAGYTCHPVLRGMVEQEGFARLWVQSLERAMRRS